MSRNQRRLLKKEVNKYAAQYPADLVPVPRDEWPPIDPVPQQVWRSSRYIVQLYNEMHGVIRLSVCRARLNNQGQKVDGLTWDELQAIKHELGFGHVYAIEVYPRDRDVINVANMRHLWLLPSPLPVGWFSSEEDKTE